MPIVLGIKITNTSPLGIKQRGRFAKWVRVVTGNTLAETAAHWHASIFTKHFGRSAESEYRYNPRSDFYKDEIKPRKGVGAGKQKGVSLQLTGMSRRQMLHLAEIKGKRKGGFSSRSVTVVMRPPRYFTNPFVGVIGTDKQGKTRRITQQPDKASEAVRVSARDTVALRKFSERSLKRQVKQMPPPEVVFIKA